MTKKEKITHSQKVDDSSKIPPIKPTNGHLELKESKRTIVFTWGKYSITALCLTAIIITFIQKLK